MVPTLKFFKEGFVIAWYTSHLSEQNKGLFFLNSRCVRSFRYENCLWTFFKELAFRRANARLMLVCHFSRVLSPLYAPISLKFSTFILFYFILSYLKMLFYLIKFILISYNSISIYFPLFKFSFFLFYFILFYVLLSYFIFYLI